MSTLVRGITAVVKSEIIQMFKNQSSLLKEVVMNGCFGQCCEQMLGMCRTPVQPVLPAGNGNTGYIGTGRY